MKFTNFGINTASGEVVGALPQFIQGAPLAVRDRSVAPDFVPTTGEVRPLSAAADLTEHPTVQGTAKGDARVRTWSPPD